MKIVNKRKFIRTICILGIILSLLIIFSQTTYSKGEITYKENYIYNGDTLFSDKDKLTVVAHNLYVGKRSEDISYNDGSIEKSDVLENKYIGLLPLYDYINASLDNNCYSAITQSCANYNYLNGFDYNWWTMTGDSNSTHRIFRISSDGKISTSRAATSIYARPVIYLAKDAVYVGGNGTLDNPYLVK